MDSWLPCTHVMAQCSPHQRCTRWLGCAHPTADRAEGAPAPACADLTARRHRRRCCSAGLPVKLQQQPSGLAFLVLEPDLQLGEAVGHVINSLAPSPAHTEQVAAGGGARHASALDVLKDPGRNTGDFAQLVEAAGLGEALSAPGAVLTLFAPSNEVRARIAGRQHTLHCARPAACCVAAALCPQAPPCTAACWQALEAFLAGLQPAARQQLQANQSVADELVSGHMVAGVALGSKALQAQRWGSLKSQAGDALAVTQDE